MEGQYDVLFSAHGVNVEEALRKSGIPEDIFSHRVSSVTREQYFHFMEVIGDSISDPETPIKIATSEQIECFSPPIFAAYCSKDAYMCIQRLAKYKRLIGPLKYYIMETCGDEVPVEITAGDESRIPRFLAEMEIVFLLHIIRSATKEHVTPVHLTMQEPVTTMAFRDFVGCGAEPGGRNRIVFSEHDLHLPFISRNDAMWSYFEPELRRRLYELNVTDSLSTRLRVALTELLPGGTCSVDDAAQKLGLSRRTLQRRLGEEGTTFQRELDHIREILAKHYLRNTSLSSGSIAYLLGYQELNSFRRAFAGWTGMKISEYRRREVNDRSGADVPVL